MHSGQCRFVLSKEQKQIQQYHRVGGESDQEVGYGVLACDTALH